ncbi:MAG: hypothetical protein QGG73_05935 [Candidatus Hydrogenedentes bacterium]|jgi:hypothetical protein|nr:hypothetical protein [Candidatus Hydrogenedentota bacterium]
MDRQSAILFGVLTIAFLAAILAASMYGGPSTGSGAQPAAAPAPEKRLRAKKEHVRKNARAITSTREEEKREPKGSSSGPADAVEVWGSLSHPKGVNAPKNGAERVAGEALTALDPEKGIEAIRANLDALDGTEGSSELYAVLVTLYARLDPPDTEAMNEYFGQVSNPCRRRRFSPICASIMLGPLLPPGNTNRRSRFLRL